jgi:hypothetical protein
MRKKDSEEARMLKEMLETAQGLQAHGVMSKVDMARIRTLCELSLDESATHHLYWVKPSAG